MSIIPSVIKLLQNISVLVMYTLLFQAMITDLTEQELTCFLLKHWNMLFNFTCMKIPKYDLYQENIQTLSDHLYCEWCHGPKGEEVNNFVTTVDKSFTKNYQRGRWGIKKFIRDVIYGLPHIHVISNYWTLLLSRWRCPGVLLSGVQHGATTCRTIRSSGLQTHPLGLDQGSQTAFCHHQHKG